MHDPCMILSTRHDPCCMCTSALYHTAESSRAARRSCAPRSPPASPAGRRSRATRRSQPRLCLRRGGPPPGQCRRSEGLQTGCREASARQCTPVHGAGRTAYEHTSYMVYSMVSRTAFHFDPRVQNLSEQVRRFLGFLPSLHQLHLLGCCRDLFGLQEAGSLVDHQPRRGVFRRDENPQLV